MAAKPRADWEAIEREYRAGQLSVREIARQFGVTDTAIHKRAKDRRWERALADKVQETVRERLVRLDGLQDGLHPQRASDREIVEGAAIRAMNLVTSHRKDLSQLHALRRILADRLSTHLQGGQPEGPFMSDKESPADVLEKLARTTARLIPLERQAYSLDKDLPDDPATKRTLTEALAKTDRAQRDVLRSLARAVTE